MKTLDDFDFSFQRSVKRDEVMHLAQLAGNGEDPLSIALTVQAARRGYRVHFATAQEWVTRLAKAKHRRVAAVTEFAGMRAMTACATASVTASASVVRLREFHPLSGKRSSAVQ